MESVEILITLRPQQAGNLGEGLPPPDMRKGEICQMFRNFQEWMETAVASLAKQAARHISALINDSDGTNEESEGLAQMFFTHVQLVRVDRDMGNEDRDSCQVLGSGSDLQADARDWGFRRGPVLRDDGADHCDDGNFSDDHLLRQAFSQRFGCEVGWFDHAV